MLKMSLPALLKGWKPLLWAVDIILFFKRTIRCWIEYDEMSRMEGPWWDQFPESSLWICFLPVELLHLIFAACFKVSWPLNDVIWWNGQSKVSQARHHICFNPARQSSMPQLFIMFLLISIMKGLIMLMRRPNGLVSSVRDTAVGLQGKSCTKCVT